MNKQIQKIRRTYIRDDSNKPQYCRHCKNAVYGLLPEECPHCHEQFETQIDYLLRVGAFLFIVVCCVFLWQKVMLGLI